MFLYFLKSSSIMNKKILLGLLIFIASLGIISAASLNTVSCNFRNDSCETGEAALFYANKNFVSDEAPIGEVLSSNIRSSLDSNYNKVLCCGSPYGTLSSQIETSFGTCSQGGVSPIYLTNDTNARIGLPTAKVSVAYYFEESYYLDKLCLNIPDEFSSFDMIVSDSVIYENAGYSCMYRVSSLENGVVSSCDATYNSGEQYPYVIWSRMWESVDSLNCNSDCTSKLDGRIYTACTSQISACREVPIGCDGALLGSWVESISGLEEVQCSAPWDISRSKVFTDEKVIVDVVEDDKCPNLISKEYSVLVNNELVTMRVYVCA